jgi:hypothetical protein
MRIAHRKSGLLQSLAFLLCVAAPDPAGAEWRRVDSPNFVVVGEVGARELRDMAVKFEGFRETLSRVLIEGATATPVLGPLMTNAFPQNIRDAARRLMQHIVGLESAR